MDKAHYTRTTEVAAYEEIVLRLFILDELGGEFVERVHDEDIFRVDELGWEPTSSAMSMLVKDCRHDSKEKE